MKSLEKGRKESGEDFEEKVCWWGWEKDIIDGVNDTVGCENIEEDRMGVKVDVDSFETYADSDSLSEIGSVMGFEESWDGAMCEDSTGGIE